MWMLERFYFKPLLQFIMCNISLFAHDRFKASLTQGCHWRSFIPLMAAYIVCSLMLFFIPGRFEIIEA